jgi:hypothetical protein
VRYQNVFNGEKQYDFSGDEVEQIVATPGSITRYRIVSNNALGPGSGKSFTFHIVLNGVTQDGTGGTTDTALALTDGNTTATWTGDLALVAGDVVYFTCTPSGSPNNNLIAIGVKFVATTDGLYNVCGNTHGTHSGDTASYVVLTNTSDGFGFGTEATHEVIAGVTPITLSEMRVKLGTAPGSGNAHILKLRINQAVPSGGPVVTISDTDTEGEDVTDGAATLESGDEASIEWTGTSGPTASRGTWSLVGDAGTPAAVCRSWPFIGNAQGPVFGA